MVIYLSPPCLVMQHEVKRDVSGKVKAQTALKPLFSKLFLPCLTRKFYWTSVSRYDASIESLKLTGVAVYLDSCPCNLE